MSTMHDGKTLTVFKFKSSGLVALCDEVTDLARSGDLVTRFGAAPETARFEETSDSLQVIFEVRRG